VLDGEEPLAEAVAARLAEVAAMAAAARGRFDLGLSGGRTPAGSYRSLAAEPWRSRLPWAITHVWFADERAVPPDDPDSNYRLVRETLLEPLGLDAHRVHRMKGEAPDLEAAARDYDAELPGPLDALLLGVGEDGHVASIFPGSPLTMERVRRVAAVPDAPKPPPRRLTITPRVIREARAVIVLATGPAKTDAVALALEGAADIRRVPARMLREYEWFTDRAAAAGLTTVGGAGAA
jgi:6-phosphogluconolactonase